MSPLFDASNYAFSWYVVPLLVAGSLNWLLGAATLWRERASTPSKTLFAMSFAIGVWLLALAGANASSDPAAGEAWVKVSMVGTVFVPLCAFTHAAIGSSRRHVFRASISCGVVVSTALAALVLSTHSVMQEAHHYFWGYYPIYGPMGIALIIYYGLFFVAGGAIYRMGQQSQSEIHRRRMKLRLAALLVAMPATIDFLPTMHVGVYPFGYAFIVGYICISTYSIWRYRLIDITPALAARQIIDTMAEGLLVFDRDGVVRVANPSAESFAGSRSLVGASCAEVDQAWEDGALSPLLDPDRMSRTEVTYRRGIDGNGTAVVSSSKLTDARGEWVGVVCIVHDITERQRSEAAVRDREALYRALVETSPDAVIVTDQAGQVLMTNARAGELTGLGPADAVGASALQFIAPADRERLQESLRGATGVMVTRQAEYTLVRSDGTPVPVELSISRFASAGGAVRIMAVVRDITERKRNEERIRYLAFHDSLTGAATREVLLDRLNDCLARARRTGSPVGLVFVDLDRFKQINDTAGHDAGDHVLREVSNVLKSSLREGDTLARVGGDEFVLLLPELRHTDGLQVAAVRILTELRRSAASGELRGVSASLGLAVFPRDGTGADELLQRADRAMYEAKSAGGDGYKAWTDCERSAA